MKILGIEGMTAAQIRTEVDNGGKFVFYQYAISIILMSFRRSSDIHFIRAGEGAVVKGLGWTILTFFAGWWGIPWGPIYTIGCIFTNLRGGKDVTREVLASFSEAPPATGMRQAPPTL